MDKGKENTLLPTSSKGDNIATTNIRTANTRECEKGQGEGKKAVKANDNSKKLSDVKRFSLMIGEKKLRLKLLSTQNEVDREKSDVPFRCITCSEQFETVLELRQHIDVHNVHETLRNCKKCGKRFRLKKKYKEHKKEHQKIHKNC
jgi:DNA-directed RNA polymerase subunit M/transcription elongation factor TFIIS